MAGAGMIPIFAMLMICMAALLAPWPVLGQRQSFSTEDDEQKLQQASESSSWEEHKLVRKLEPGVFECAEELVSLGACITDLYSIFNPRARKGGQRRPLRRIGRACCDAVGGIGHSCLAAFVKWAADGLHEDVDFVFSQLQKSCEGLAN